ncbi:MAG: GIY-YIG nuclease family protein [Rhizomicrobium sp.]
MRKGYVYLLASKPYGTLYIGVTNNLSERVHAHRIGRGCDFTRKYNVTRLVWWEVHDLVVTAIQRETNMKRWKRDWKSISSTRRIRNGWACMKAEECLDLIDGWAGVRSASVRTPAHDERVEIAGICG